MPAWIHTFVTIIGIAVSFAASVFTLIRWWGRWAKRELIDLIDERAQAMLQPVADKFADSAEHLAKALEKIEKRTTNNEVALAYQRGLSDAHKYRQDEDVRHKHNHDRDD